MKKLPAFLILMLLSSAALAAQDKVIRPATKQDLIGEWEMISAQPIRDPKDPAFSPYQRFLFKPDSSMKFMVSQAPFQEADENQFRNEPTAIDYAVDEKGLLTLSWQQKPFSERMMAGFVERDFPAEAIAKVPAERRHKLPKKGDLTLSYLAGGKVAFQKIFRKRSA